MTTIFASGFGSIFGRRWFKAGCLLGSLSTGSALAAGCTSDFHSCEETRTCARGGSAGAGAESGEAGEQPVGAGGASGSSGASAVDAGSAGEEAGGSISGSGGEPAVDTTPPKIVSIEPADGETSVSFDAKIVVTFSEQVDHTAAEAALISSAGALTFGWNGASTVLTATPSVPLEYATGADAKTYTVQVSTGLKDLAGNHSVKAFTSSFSTSRELSLKISRPVLGLVEVSSGPSVNVSEGDASLFVGDSAFNNYDRAFPWFDITALPATLTSVVSAKLTIPINLKIIGAGDVDTGNPFTDLGDLLVEHFYDWPIQVSSLTKARLSPVGALMTGATATTGTSSIDVTASVFDDFTNRITRENRSMYRLLFPKTTDNDAKIDCVTIPYNGTVSLDITYLAP